MAYAKKRVEVEAFQVTPMALAGPDWPAWITRAALAPQNQPGSLHAVNPDVPPEQFYEPAAGKDSGLRAETVAGTAIVRFGDWLVHDAASGLLDVVGPDRFAEVYEEIPEGPTS